MTIGLKWISIIFAIAITKHYDDGSSHLTISPTK